MKNKINGKIKIIIRTCGLVLTCLSIVCGCASDSSQRQVQIKTEDFSITPQGVMIKNRKPADKNDEEELQIGNNGKVKVKSGKGKDAYSIEVDKNKGGVIIDTRDIDIKY